jgi:ABC-2 type transport system ATP-binding protein
MIEVKNLTKSYGANKAVDDISFTAESGQILGFLGPNGAGLYCSNERRCIY